MKIDIKIWVMLLALFSFSLNATEQANRLSEEQFEKTFNTVTAKMDQLPETLKAKVNGDPCLFCELVLKHCVDQEARKKKDELPADKARVFKAFIGFCVELKRHQSFCKNKN